MRPLCLVATLTLALAGCGSSDKPTGGDASRTGSLLDYSQAASALGEKLKTLSLKEEKPTIRVERPENRTSHSMDLAPLEEELKKALLDSKKFAVLAGTDYSSPTPTDPPAADYVLTTKVSNEVRKSSSETVEHVDYNFEITKRPSREIVLSTSHRKVTSK